MKNNEDRLDVLKDKYLKLIESKELEINTIRQKLVLLDELKAEADGLNLFPMPVSAQSKADALKDHPFAATGLTESVMKSIGWFGANFFSPPEMRDYLLKNGFKPTGKNFNISVATTLKRLATQKRILTDHLNGKTVYKAKP